MTKIVCIRRAPLRRVGLLLGRRRRQLHGLAQEVRHVVTKGHHRSVVLALARLVLAVMTAVAALGLRPSVRPRRRFRLRRFRMAPVLLLGRLLRMLGAAMVPLRLGVRLVPGGTAAAAAAMLAVAGLEFELGDALDLDARDLLAD